MFDTKKIISLTLGGIAAFAAVVGGIFGVYKLVTSNSGDGAVVDPGPTKVVVNPTPDKIDLQLAVNQWVDTQANPNDSAVLIYDLDNSAIVARHNEDQMFDMGQLYQMFIAYEGYYKMERDNWDPYGEYTAIQTNRKTCLKQMIQWSDVACSDAMWDEIGRDKLQEFFSSLEFKTQINSFTSNVSELAHLYQLYWDHTDFSDDTWKIIRDSMINQEGNPTFDGQNLRQGLPSGFAVAKVYNKAGWYKNDGNWYTYDDAAFVEFAKTENRDKEQKPARHYIIISMTRSTDPKQVVILGRNIESAVRTADNY